MGSQFAKTMFSPAAKRLQELHNSRAQYERLAALGPRDEALGEFEQQFIAARDSFYLGSVTEDGGLTSSIAAALLASCTSSTAVASPSPTSPETSSTSPPATWPPTTASPFS